MSYLDQLICSLNPNVSILDNKYSQCGIQSSIGELLLFSCF